MPWKVMRCSELAEVLRDVQYKYGDLPVHMADWETDTALHGTAVGTIHVNKDYVMLDMAFEEER